MATDVSQIAQTEGLLEKRGDPECRMQMPVFGCSRTATALFHPFQHALLHPSAQDARVLLVLVDDLSLRLCGDPAHKLDIGNEMSRISHSAAILARIAGV